VTLSAGSWVEDSGEGNDASGLRVVLLEEIFLTGDVTGNGRQNAVVFLHTSGAGTGSFLTIAVLERQEENFVSIAMIELGDRVQIRAARLEANSITMDLVQHSSEDAMCCPGDLIVRSWTWKNGAFSGSDPAITGRLEPSVLSGESWRLVAWNSQELMPDSIDITITYQDGSLTGSAGCNRYGAMVRQSNIPGDISIGRSSSTKMMCHPDLMLHEDRFLSILPFVNHFGFLNGQLFMGYVENDVPRILLFEKVMRS